MKKQQYTFKKTISSILFVLIMTFYFSPIVESTENTNIIHGRILMGTKGELLPDNIIAKLFKIEESLNQIIEIESSKIDKNGKFKFKHEKQNNIYRILIIGGEYIDYRDILPGDNGYIEITIFSSTNSLKDISILNYSIMLPIINPKDRNVGFLSVAKVNNSSDRVWIPDIGNPNLTGLDLFRFNLPEGYKSLSVESELPEGNIMEINTGFAMTNPIPPGEYSIIMSYELEYNKNNFNFPLRLPFGADNIKIMIPTDAGFLSSKYLKKTEHIFVNNTNFQVFEGDKIDRGSQLDVNFNNLPEPILQEKIINFINNGSFSIVLISSFSVTLIIVIIFMIYKKKSAPEKFTDSQKKNIILIANLDKDYESKKISQKHYQSRRKELIDKIMIK